MELNLRSLESHEYQKINDDKFQFINSFGVEYEVYFTTGEYYFPEVYYRKYLKTFGFSPISSTNFDFEIKTANTITLILVDYFEQDDYIVMYVCDQSDKKQSVRNRLFNLWFSKYNNGSFEKIDLSYEQSTFVSAIINKNNPFYIDFKQDFPNLGEGYK